MCKEFFFSCTVLFRFVCFIEYVICHQSIFVPFFPHSPFPLEKKKKRLLPLKPFLSASYWIISVWVRVSDRASEREGERGLRVVSGSQRLSSATGTQTLMNRFPSLHSCACRNPRANPEQLPTRRRRAATWRPRLTEHIPRKSVVLFGKYSPRQKKKNCDRAKKNIAYYMWRCHEQSQR